MTDIFEQVARTALPVAVDVHALQLTDAQFLQLCRDNRDLRFELTAEAALIIMPPTGSLTGWRNADINYQLTAWAKGDGTGLTFDSSTGFKLPNGAKRSPDAAWIKRDRWDVLTDQEKEGFAPICPDFVLELRSADDSLPALQDKMAEYLDNGAQLGWLIDPKDKRVYVYRPGQSVECLEQPEGVSGDAILPAFVFNLKGLW
ncbi:MAG TPA: Uma2 family endonuclease [Blastocatellia bacterium]|nr:Uma2 family endonuclease [Blastocatellia bacterium]